MTTEEADEFCQKALAAKTDGVTVIGPPLSTKQFFQELAAVLKKDAEDHPAAYVGVIIYPINGRAATIDPFDHYSMDREEVVSQLMGELADSAQVSEEELREAHQLLKDNDCVRCGRIICHILSYPRSIKTTGVERYV